MRDYPIVITIREKVAALLNFETNLTDVGIAILGSLPDWPISDIGEELDCENFKIYEINENDMLVSCGGDWQTPEMFWIYHNNGVLTYKKIAWDFKRVEICDTDIIPGENVFQRIEELERIFTPIEDSN